MACQLRVVGSNLAAVDYDAIIRDCPPSDVKQQVAGWNSLGLHIWTLPQVPRAPGWVLLLEGMGECKAGASLLYIPLSGWMTSHSLIRPFGVAVRCSGPASLHYAPVQHIYLRGLSSLPSVTAKVCLSTLACMLSLTSAACLSVTSTAHLYMLVSRLSHISAVHLSGRLDEPPICYLYSASTGVSVPVRSICTDQLECMYMSTGVSVGVNGEAHQASQFCMCQHTYSHLLTKPTPYSPNLPTPRFQPYLPPTKSPHNPKDLINH